MIATLSLSRSASSMWWVDMITVRPANRAQRSKNVRMQHTHNLLVTRQTDIVIIYHLSACHLTYHAKAQHVFSIDHKFINTKREAECYSTCTVFEQQVPDRTSGVGVHPRCGLIQDHHLGATNKSQGNWQLPLHAPWVRAQILAGVCLCVCNLWAFLQFMHANTPERFWVSSSLLWGRPRSCSMFSTSSSASGFGRPFSRE